VTDEQLGREARELIEQALREEKQADPAELAQVRKRVLTVSVGVGALGSAGKTFAVPGAIGAVSIMKAALLGASAAVVAVSLSSVLGLHEPAPAPNSAPAPAPNSAPAPAAPERAQPAPLEPVVQMAPVEHQAALETGAAPTPQPVSPPPAARRSEGGSPVPAPIPPPLPAPTAEPQRESTDAPSANREGASSAAGSDSSLLQEIALLEQVQAALRAGNGARALSLLDQKSPASGSGQLGAERLAAEVFAACQVGDRQRAGRAARLFLQAYPATPASARVRASCAGEEAER